MAIKENLLENIYIGYKHLQHDKRKIYMPKLDGFNQFSRWQNLYPMHFNEIPTIISKNEIV